MFEEEKDDVTQDSSTAEDVNSESSTEETQSEEATSQEATEKEQTQSEHVPYDRFQDVVQQKQHWQDIATQLTEKFQQPNAPAATQQEMDVIQKYGAQDPATREFLRDIREQNKVDTQKQIESAAQPLIRENEALRRTVASMQERVFRQENKDVKQGSPEEVEIARYISMGMPLDKATMAVMGSKRIEEAKTVGQVKAVNKNKVKANANLETQSIPQVSGLPQHKSMNFKNQLRENMNKSGL